MLPTEYPRHRPEPSTLCPCPVWSCRHRAPLFCGGEAPVDKALIPADLVLVLELGEEGAPEFQQDTADFPVPESTPAGRWAAVFPGQLTPRRSCPEDPEDALQTAAIVDGRTSALGPRLPRRQMDANLIPLRLAEMAPGHDSAPVLRDGSWHL